MSKRNQPSEDVASVTFRGLDESVQGIVDTETLDTENYHYRFIQDRPQNIARKRSLGYVNVLAEEEGVQTLTGEVSADGLIRDGDSILMRVPKERIQARRKRTKQFADLRLANVDQQFKKKAKEAKVQAGEFSHTLDEDQVE